MTTLSTYDEVRTPEQRSIARFEMGPDPVKPVVGPRGPHLFRSSISSVNSLEYQNALSMSPITPKAPHQIGQALTTADFHLPISLDLAQATPRATTTPPPRFRFTREPLVDTTDLARWAPEKVAQWMLDAGVELQFAEKFVENDINGAILITLKFEDLKELGIASFGVRTKIWEEVAKMKDMPRAGSPDPETPIEDEPSREVKREVRRQERREQPGSGGGEVKRSQSSRRRKAHNDAAGSGHNVDTIRPDQSVSIVGIEQVLPKPHNCSKGEKCRKWKKQQRMIEAFKNDHPFVSLDSGGVVMIAGDPGNPDTAKAIRPEDEVVLRPVSDAVPSVVASSDILGTEGLPPLQYLQQAALRNAQADAKAQEQHDNVRHFLELQHQIAANDGDVPPTPPFEMLPPRRAAPHGGLKSLSKLSIPIQPNRSVEEVPESACPGSACPGSAYPSSAHPFAQPPPPSFAAQQRKAAAPPTLLPTPSPSPSPSPDSRSQTPTGVYRFGTPFSEMDVPYTSVPMTGPVARDASQSVPPEMNYHTVTNPPPPSRSLSRSTFRRPSFMAMPPVAENAVTPPADEYMPPTTQGGRRRIPSPIETSDQISPRSKQQQQQQQTRPLHAPPRAAWPWSPPASARHFETAIAPLPPQQHNIPNPPASTFNNAATDPALAGHPKDLDGYQYQGYMKKRKTKMLRHEWHEQYVTLKGTRLAMHKDRRAVDRTLEYVDIDDYAIACAGLASTSKLNAAFKAMSIRRDKGMTKADIAAFSFQLVPQAEMKGGAAGRLRKRESGLEGAPMFKRSGSWDGGSTATASTMSPPPEGVNGTGKTHHFAVRSRDERIDWMRELMLAKALKQKGEGFEVSVNGNMI